MKIALCQMNIKWEDKEENFFTTESQMLIASEMGAEVLFLPEMSFTGFSMNTTLTAENDKFTVNRMKELCRKYNIALGFGWVRRCEDKAENCYTIVDKTGEELCTYVKVHPFSYGGEDKFFARGTELVSYKLGGMTFSTAICYDTRFPELFQGICKNNKTDVIVIPANWPAKRAEHWKTLVRARAIENQVYIIAVNCVGEIGGTEYSGDSCIINPNGEIVKCAESYNELIFAELDYDIKNLRKTFPVRQDRQLELYKKIL
ncbi:MAG: carbon-nitrogen family hydrolase [Acutalibacteraceae bacterium]|nr:carbon-nitrogen family hydrolase [Acutalibacteraceae bacterium]